MPSAGGYRLVQVAEDPFRKVVDQPGIAPGWIADPQKMLRPATVEEQMAGPRNKLLDLTTRDLAPRLSYQQLLDERQAQREGGVHPGRMDPYPRTMGDDVAIGAMSLPLGALSVIGGGIKGGVNLLRNLATLPQRMTAAERTGGTEAALDLAVGPATETALTLMTGGAGRALTAGRTRAELGIFGGPGARTADHGALARAQERLAAGESRDRVWKETGWGKDQYGHWFFEIPDDKIRIRMEPGDTAVRGRADEFVDHPEMFDAYPILRDANVTIRIDPSLKHSRDGSAQYTLVNIVDDQGRFVRADPPIMSIVVTAKNEQAARETLVHEFEHLVQGLEGRERGGSMQDQPVLDMARAEFGIDRDRALPRYREVLAEKQAFTQDWIARNRDNFPDPVMAEFAAERAFGRERGELASEFYSLREKLYGEGARLSMRDAVFNAYRRLRGEVQALNAEKRTDWDAESRANVGPWRTEEHSEDRQWTQGNQRAPITVRDPNAVRSVDQQATEAAMAASVGRQGDTAQGEMFPELAAGQMVESPAFKRWFGNSAVVEPRQSSREPARPRVMYHGTSRDFSSFDPNQIGTGSTVFGSYDVNRAGFFFSPTPDEAAGYATQHGDAGASIMPVYLSIQKPLDLDRLSVDDWRRLENVGLNPASMERMNAWELFDGEQGRDFVDSLKRAGYDGAVFSEMRHTDGQTGETWVAFDQGQIKSATGNRGSFDPADPDITRAAPDPREAGFNYASGWPENLPKPAIYDRAVALGEKLRADAQTASGRSWDLEMARRGGEPLDEVAYASSRAAATQASDDSWRLDMAIRDVRLASTPAERASSVAKLEQVYRELSGGAVKGAARRTSQPARRGALAGAPADVRSPRDEVRRRKAYLDFVMQGLEGRRWYEDSGGAIAFAAGDRREQTRRLAEAFAITSQRTNVSGNTGFAVQASNQAAVGMPIRTGAFPSKMSPRLQEALTGEGAASGQKVEPFAEQLMIGAGQGTGRAAGERAVHDMWDAQAWGYAPEAVKGGLGATQHRWMDRQVDRVVEYLNKNNVDGGGWTVGQVQAAAWTGVRKQRDSSVPGAYSFADALPRTYAQGSRETVPGDTTGHLVGLADAPMEVRQAYDDEVADIIYDAKGRDRIAMGFGGLPGGSFRGPGIFEGGINPGRQSLLATAGAGGVGGSRALDEASTALLDATEATYGLLTAQKAAAYNRIFGAPRGVSNGAVIKLPGGPMSVEQATEIMRSGRYGGDVAVVPDREGVRLLYFGTDKDAFQATARAMADTLKGEKPRWGVVGGNLIENAWDKPEGRVGQQYMERIDRPELPRLGPSFDELAPPIAAKIRALDERWARRGFQVSPLIQELRAAISADGRAGVYKLAKKLGLGAAAITPFTQAGQAMGLLDEEGNPIEDRAPYRGRERREAYRTGASF